MEHSRSRRNPYLIRTAGLGSILGGLLLLGGIFYILIVLGSYGFNTHMFGDINALLPWAHHHGFAYSILWLHQIIFGLIMSPVPFAASQLFRQHHSSRSSALATLSYQVGMIGFVLIIISAIIFLAVSPVTSRVFSSGMQDMRYTHEIFDAIGTHLRIFGIIMVSMWIMGIGIYLIRKNIVDMFAWFSFALFIFTLVVGFGKIYKAFDWEPFLNILLAFTFLWLGWIMRQKS